MTGLAMRPFSAKAAAVVVHPTLRRASRARPLPSASGERERVPLLPPAHALVSNATAAGGEDSQVCEAMGDFITPPSMEAVALPRMANICNALKERHPELAAEFDKWDPAKHGVLPSSRGSRGGSPYTRRPVRETNLVLSDYDRHVRHFLRREALSEALASHRAGSR